MPAASRPTACAPARGGSRRARASALCSSGQDLRLHHATAFELDLPQCREWIARNRQSVTHADDEPGGDTLWRPLRLSSSCQRASRQTRCRGFGELNSRRAPGCSTKHAHSLEREAVPGTVHGGDLASAPGVVGREWLDCSCRSQNYGSSHARLPANHGAGHWAFDES